VQKVKNPSFAERDEGDGDRTFENIPLLTITCHLRRFGKIEKFRSFSPLPPGDRGKNIKYIKHLSPPRWKK
jgi:hypothetical protein